MSTSTATQAHTYPNLKRDSLLSTRKLCDSNCSTIFTKKEVTILNSDNTPVLNGTRNTSDGLWDVTIENSKPEQPPTATINQHANYVLLLEKTKSELASYLHAYVGCPTKSTFIQEINNGNFISQPGLTLKLISKHLPLYLTTLKGHLKQEKQNIRSTKKIATIEKPEAEASTTQESKTQIFFIATKESGTTYSDLTGIYSIIPSSKNQYIVICYDYDTNSIQATPTKRGHQPNIHILDNEA